VKFYASINWLQPQPRWVACFDLLGFCELVRQRNWSGIVDVYAKALDEAHAAVGTPIVECVWFSDTFLFYTPDDSGKSFDHIRQVARFFMRGLFQRKIPATGALACDDSFADKTNQIYVGEALVECSRIRSAI
jgi:hypothetical protein